jgi:hypothetical protein
MDDDLLEAISDHIERHLGPVDDVLHDLIPDDVHIDIHIVPPTDKRPFYTLITSGMSENAMSLPEEVEGQLSAYAELLLCLPKDWQIDKTDDPRWNWPMKWLWFLAKYPVKYDTWLYISHTIPNTEDCDPFGPGTGQCCWFVRGPQTVPEAFLEMKFGDRTVVFMSLTAIYRAEMDFALSGDMDTRYALDQALAEAGVTELINPTRPELTLNYLKRHLGKLPTA